MDIYKQERQYYNMNLSAKIDIEEVFCVLDKIKQDSDNGNYEAKCIYLDFEKLLPDNPIVNEYKAILLGEKPYKDIDYGKSVIELVAKRLIIPVYEAEKILEESIHKMIQNNKDLWLAYVNKNYKGKTVPKRKTSKYVYSNKNDNSLYALDYKRKYLVPNMLYKKVNYPNDLQELIDAQNKNQAKIDEMELLNKESKLTKEQKDQLTKRNTFNIQLCQNISILKEHYKIPIEKTGQKPGFEKVGYDGDFMVEDVSLEDLSNDYIFDEWQLKLIKDIAEEVLTPKQLYLFKLHYVGGFKQHEIVELLSEDKGNISRDLKIINGKIKKNLKKIKNI